MSNRVQQPLTPKQQSFVEEFMVDLNATQAYLRAGYRANTNTVARVESSKLLAKPNIQVAIQSARQQLSERTHVDQDMVIQGLCKEATYTGENATHSARVSAWGHLARYFLPVP
ncbi:MAG: terminase small subunit, partial [Chloroflexi bacterium]|nr:terminase small subunit [Chloroflexota bacterium]